MVAGGDTNLVEVIDTKSEKKCQALPSVPKSILLDAFGALIDGKPLICGGRDEDFYTTKVHTDILKIFKLFFCTLWQAYCSICLCFLLHRHLPAKPALNSKQSAKGYERIIQEILRRSGYFNKMYFLQRY